MPLQRDAQVPPAQSLPRIQSGDARLRPDLAPFMDRSPIGGAIGAAQLDAFLLRYQVDAKRTRTITASSQVYAESLPGDDYA